MWHKRTKLSCLWFTDFLLSEGDPTVLFFFASALMILVQVTWLGGFTCIETITGLASMQHYNTTLSDLLGSCGNRDWAESAGTCAISTVISSQNVFNVPSHEMQLSCTRRCSVGLILLKKMSIFLWNWWSLSYLLDTLKISSRSITRIARLYNKSVTA